MIKNNHVLGLVLIGMGLSFEVSHFFNDNNKQAFAKITDGVYKVYDVKGAFDPKTGEPVYWVIGAKMSGKEYNPPEVFVYSIPRSMVTNLPNDSQKDPDLHDWRLVVKDRLAVLLK